jgi:cyclic pyranopterin monophosphate synthase
LNRGQAAERQAAERKAAERQGAEDTSPSDGPQFTHVDEQGEARMVDVGGKQVTRRVARAAGRVYMNPQTMALLQRQALPKGDVLAVARVAGVLAAKRTSDLIPLCHPLALTHVEIDFEVLPEEPAVEIQCTVRTEGRTGVEMEALTGVSVAALTIYDMAKAVDKAMVIAEVRLLEKTGGKEDYVRSEPITSTAREPQSGAAGRAAPAARVVSVNISPGKGERKKPVELARLITEHGIEGDGHAGPWHRQVSLLAQESIDKMVAKGLDVRAGDFAENLTTVGIDLPGLPLGTRMTVGDTLLEVTQIGKVCHDRCAIFYQAGDCVMPRDGIFVRVLQGGEVRAGDSVSVVVSPDSPSSEPEGEA